MNWTKRDTKSHLISGKHHLKTSKIPFGSGGDWFKTPWRVNPGPGAYEQTLQIKQPNKQSSVFESKVEKLSNVKVEWPFSETRETS